MEQTEIYKLIKTGQFEQALSALFENIESRPEEVENYINAAILLAEAGELEKAEKCFQRAITLEPENGAIYYNMANVYYNEGRFQEAIRLYQTSVKNGVNDVDVNYMIGMAFTQLDAHKEALPYFMRAVELDTQQDVEIQFQYGLTLCRLELFEQAVAQLEHVLTLDAKHVDAHYNLGLAQFMIDEDIDKAIDTFEKAVALQPDHHLSQHAIQTFKAMRSEEV